MLLENELTMRLFLSRLILTWYRVLARIIPISTPYGYSVGGQSPILNTRTRSPYGEEYLHEDVNYVIKLILLCYFG